MTKTLSGVLGELRTGRVTGVMRAALPLALSIFAGCDVTNPGPVQDEFLNLKPAHQALVNGAGRQLAVVINDWTLRTGHAAREIFPSGQAAPGGLGAVGGAGSLLSSNSGGPWSGAQQARWIAEDAIRRFTTGIAGQVDPAVLSQAYLWAGFSNRTLGENMCEAVIDAGPRQPNSAFFTRAVDDFTKAIEKGTGEVKTAAYGGRAAAYLWLKDYDKAIADANQVPLAFKYVLSADGTYEDTRNAIYEGNANNPFRAQSIHFTWEYDYYAATGDPRTAWKSDPKYPYGTQSLAGYPGGLVPWSYALKYKSRNDGWRLTSGREAVLIRAEAALQKNKDIAGALALINSIRTTVISDKTGLPLGPATAATETDAWTALKRERAAELWLEARRMGDLRRWKLDKTPGEIDWPNWEKLSINFVQNPPGDCYPIPDSELDRNPHL